MSEPINIRRYLEVVSTPKLEDGVDAIFFESSNTKSFESETARGVFRERWLGRYLKHDPRFAYMALAAGEVVGYLVGAVDDPASTPRFADIDYFAALHELTRKFPAHLHVNIAPDSRNRGIGARLIDHFVSDARATGVPGVHVITAAESRNVCFYNRNGFLEVARAGRGGQFAFLARRL